MRQSDGYIDKKRPNHVCKLKKSIYGLKQAACCWNFAIDVHLKLNRNKNCGADPCVYIKSVRQSNGRIDFVILAIWVDDILIFSDNIDMQTQEKASIGSRFKVEDLGKMHYILGMCVKQDHKSKTLSLSQPKYLEGILKRFNMDNCKPVSTLLKQGNCFH